MKTTIVKGISEPLIHQQAAQTSSITRMRIMTLLWTVLVLLGGFALRLYQLGVASVWYDESVSIWLASLDPANIIARTAIDIHPPGYYLLLGGWQNLTGRSEFAFSYFSVVWSMLLIALTYRFARMLFQDQRLLAPLTASLMAFSPFQIWYSQEIRMYTIGATLALLSVMFAWRMLDQWAVSSEQWAGKTALRWYRNPMLIGYVLATATSLYTLYYSAFLIIALNIYMLIMLWRLPNRMCRRHGIQNWLSAQLVAAGLYVPWLPIALQQAIWPPVPPWRTSHSWQDTLVTTWQVYVLGQSVELEQGAPVLWGVALLYLLGILGSRLWDKQDWSRSLLLLTYAWGPVLVIHLLSYMTPLYFKRYMFIYSPAVPLTLAVGLTTISGAWQRFGKRSVGSPIQALSIATSIIICIALLASFAYSTREYFFNPKYQMDDLRGAMHYLDERVRPGDAILIDAGYTYPAFLYYYRGSVAWRGRLTTYADQQVRVPASDTPQAVVLQAGSITTDMRLGGGNPYSDFYPMSEADVDRSLSAVGQQHSRVWLVRIYDTVTDPTGFIRLWLAQHWTLASDQVFSGEANMRIQLYLTGYNPPPQNSTNLNLGGRLDYLGYDLNRRSVPAGDAVYPALTWRVRAPIPEGVRMYVQLIGSDGYRWVYDDRTPLGEEIPAQRWPSGQTFRDVPAVRIPHGTPPGRYKLQAGFYLQSNGIRLAPANASVPELDLGTIEVTRPATPPGITEAVRGLDTPLTRPETMLSAQLLGAQLGLAPSYRPGEKIESVLLWQSLTNTANDQLSTYIRLRELKTSEVGDTRRGTRSAWTPGEIIRDPHTFTIPPDAPDGTYTLEAVITDTQTRAEKARELSQIRVIGPQRSFTPPSVQVQQPATFRTSDGVPVASLYGYTLEKPSIKAGESFTVTLAWRAEERTSISYKVGVQLLGANGVPVGQSDEYPLKGERPTTSWLPGEYLNDSYIITPKADAASGQYTLIVVLYDPAVPGLPRLITGEPDNKVTLNQRVTLTR